MNEFNFIIGLLSCSDTGSLELAEALLSKSTNPILLKEIQQHLSQQSLKMGHSLNIEKEALDKLIVIESQLSNRLNRHVSF